MRMLTLVVLTMTFLSLNGCSESPNPPVANQIPHTLTAHDEDRVDEYYWLRERENPEVISYLENENAYTETMMAPTKDLQETLFQEMIGRIEKDDSSVPVFSRGFWYYTRFIEGGEYAIHCRRKGTMEAPEEVMFDGNAMGEGLGYFALTGIRISSDNKTAAYAVDTVGRRKYIWHFRDLATGQDHGETIADMAANGTWAEDGKTFFYVRKDPETLRSYQIWRHELDTDPAGDVLVYEESDETFSVGVGKTKSRDFLVIHSSQTMADEVRILPSDQPTGEWRIFQPRERGLEYSVNHDGERFVVRNNLDAVNFKLSTCRAGATGKESWQDLVAHRDDVYQAGFQLFNDFLVVQERRGGLMQIRVQPWTGDGAHDLAFDDPTYDTWAVSTPELDSTTLRFAYSSLTTPSSIYDYDMTTHQKTLRKRDKVLGEFDPSWYASEYIHATAADGTLVPISLVYRKDRLVRGQNPCLLYAYGSYGYSMDAGFASWRLSLLDRGFVYAIAHVRGGQEMGRHWYEDGKLLKKKNTFTDFIDCGRHLQAEKWTDPARLYAMGGSAGGLLVGAVVNMAPEVWHGAVAQVPFVDVITTMLDDTIPLTTGEYDEWGNPNDKVSYDYMLSYSPYDQVEAKDYPNLLVTTGLHDSQVQYWEPAKWVARLRALKTDQNLLLMHTNMEAGHGGASGRFRRFKEKARECGFLLGLAGVEQ